jgi:hypothetical protein
MIQKVGGSFRYRDTFQSTSFGGQQFQDQGKEGALPDTSPYSSYVLNRAFHHLQKISILTSVSQAPLDIPAQ